MTRVTRPSALAALALALLVPSAPRAQSLSLRFIQAYYKDGQEQRLSEPEGVACGDGALVVADTGNARLVRYALQGGAISLAATWKLDAFRQPTALQLDSKGNLLALDRKARKIGRVDPQGAFGGWVEPKGLPAGEVVVPVAFKVDASDGLVVLDAAARRVLVLSPAGEVRRQAPLPKGVFTDVAVDAAGVVYAVDAADAVIWSLAKDAAELKPLSKSMKDVLVYPAFLAATSRGVLLAADQHGHGVVLVGLDGSFMGRQLAAGFGEGAVYYPSQLCMNERGEVFVADRYNNRVQAFATQR